MLVFLFLLYKSRSTHEYTNVYVDHNQDLLKNPIKTEQSMKVKYSTGGCFLQNYILKAIKNATLSLDLILMQHMVLSTKLTYTL